MMCSSHWTSLRNVPVPELALAPTMNATVVSTIDDLMGFLASIRHSSVLYMDLEGKELSRHGTLTIITILVQPQNTVFLIDVQTLGHTAFLAQPMPTLTEPLRSLKYILEDPTVTKYLWDVRNDADALKALYGVGIEGVIDIQLLENATRYGSKEYLRGLNRCVQMDLNLSDRDHDRWVRIKDHGTSRMGSDHFSVRPLAPETIDYCAGDVWYLPQLRNSYMRFCTPQKFERVRAMSMARVREAHSPGYQPNGPQKKFGPWGHNGI